MFEPNVGVVIELMSEADTMQFGETLATKTLSDHWLLALQGDLGAGKTTLVKGLARGLGITDEVSSPTFAILQIYNGGRSLLHCDWYRLNRESELDAIGWDELVDNQPRIVVEWADRFPNRLPDNTRYLNFSFHGENRIVTLGAGW